MARRLLRHALATGLDAEAAYLALCGDRSDAFWLDGSGAGISYLGLGTPVDLGPDPFAALAALVAETDTGTETDTETDAADADADVELDGADHEPGFRLGWVGWLGYELRGLTTGAAVPRTSRYPDAAFLRVDRAVAIDGATGAAELLALGEDWSGELGEWRDVTAATLAALDPRTPPLPPTAASPTTAVWTTTGGEHLAAVEDCQSAIREGEAYQLCLTTEVEVPGRHDPVDVHRRLRRTSPSHHGGLLRIGEVSLVSASPERFLSIDRSGLATTSPIKGTRPRGADPESDARLAAELLASEKERAENLMIVDLMRNDLSRVSELGTVEVTRLMEVETYAQVHQLVSTVRGRLRHDVSPLDAVAACFPAGSMTGAPKRRATEVLDGLERRARGLYAGAFGYIGVDGAVDLAMTIRSVVIDARGATLGTGGGITALSVPEEELAEIRVKAAPLLAALGAG